MVVGYGTGVSLSLVKTDQLANLYYGQGKVA
jgi:hypothetical protein